MASSKNTKLIGPNEWAKRTARRLRVSHHSFSDQTFEEKREFLEDELDFALGDVGAESGSIREKYLKALIELFPVFGQDDSVLSAAPEAQGAEKQLSAVEKVMEGWGEASEDERSLIMAQLGLEVPSENPVDPPSGGGEVPRGIAMPDDTQARSDLERTMSQVSRVFQVMDGEDISFTRLFKLAGILVDNFDKLHSFVWEFWDFICPNDAVGMLEPDIMGGFRSAVHDYLTDGNEMSSGKISREVDTTKLMVLAVCSSINQGGEEFGRQFGNRFSPDEIESSVVIEDTGGDPSRVKDLERKSWLKYRQLAKNLTPEGVDDELKVLIGHVIAAWMKRNRK